MIIEAPAYLDTCTERQWQDLVRETAVMNHWLIYHTHDSRRSDKGFPDLTLARTGFLLFLELKTSSGRVTPEQQVWIDTLNSIYGPVKAMIARPRDWDYLSRLLDNPWGSGQLPLGANP